MTSTTLRRSVLVSDPICGGSGPRVALKDVFDIAGEVTAACSRTLADAEPAQSDAEVVVRMKAADCALVGRANMHELAYGVTGTNTWTGTPLNPFWPDLIPGGSSSGSAVAAALGLCDFALGTDTGGSIRMPAACCGVIGLKPSFGRISRRGITPAASSLDCVGPLARDMAMIDRAMAILCPGWNASDISAPSGQVQVCWLETAAPAEIDRPVRDAASAIGKLTNGSLRGQAAAMSAGLTLIGHENWKAFGHLVGHPGMGADIRDRLGVASRISKGDVDGAEAIRQAFTAEVDALFERFDVLALPTLPAPVPTLLEAGDPARIVPLTANVRPFNLSGHPAIALPVGEVSGRPVSLQLVGRRGADEALCRLARLVTLFTPERPA